MGKIHDIKWELVHPFIKDYVDKYEITDITVVLNLFLHELFKNIEHFHFIKKLNSSIQQIYLPRNKTMCTTGKYCMMCLGKGLMHQLKKISQIENKQNL